MLYRCKESFLSDFNTRGLMCGMRQDQAIEALTVNPGLAFKHAHMRKTFKGVAELIDLKKGTNLEEEKMQV
jgi:hypothetical protein